MESAQSARKFVSGKLLATREGTIALGVGAAVLAGIIILVYVTQYRKSVDQASAPVNVMVARSLIESGTSGEVVGQKELFQVQSTPKEQVKLGALSDPAFLNGHYAVADMYPGQQITSADFAGITGSAVGTQLVDRERAVAVPVDTSHGLIGTVQASDHVDLLVSFGSPQVIKTLLQDILVLQPPGGGSGSIGGTSAGSNMIVQVRSPQAAKLAFAADNGKIWVILRPRSGGKHAPPSTVTQTSILRGR